MADSLSSQPGIQFASDNVAGLCPEAWAELVACNQGFAKSYGDDSWTEAASNAFREFFDCPDLEVFFVYNGTAANSLALASLCQSYHSVITHETSHIETDECGAPEFFSNGTKLLLARGGNGKLAPDEVENLIRKRTDIHYPRPNVVSLTQSTELGTVYQPEEIQAVSTVARRHGLKVHMDGARFTNALASLGCHPSEVTWKAGVDVLCFGCTKAGFGLGEAVVFFRSELAREFDYRCKQAGQLASKMRFFAAPLTAAFRHDSWLKYARHANACATRLAAGLVGLPGVEVLYPVQSNAVFVRLPDRAHQQLKELGWQYYVFIGGGARFMCSWATPPEAIDALLHDIRAAIAD